MPFPLIKLGYLLVRTVAKPIAGAFKRQARDHPWFRSACGRVAQTYHRSEVKMKRRIAAKNGGSSHEPVEHTIRPLDEQKAVELGGRHYLLVLFLSFLAEFLGEALIFGVAGSLLLLDTARNNRLESARRAAIEQRFQELYGRIEELEKQRAAV